MSEPVYFLKLEMENVCCFGEKAVLDLSDGQGNWRQWTVILGDNGTGKTTLLQALAMHQPIKDKARNTAGQMEMIFTPTFNEFYYRLFPKEKDLNYEVYARIKTIAFFSNIQMLGFNTNYGIFSSTNIATLGNVIIYSYSGNRSINNEGIIANTKNKLSAFLDENIGFVNAEKWLLQLDYAASKESPVQQYAIYKCNQVKQTLIDLLPDVSDIQFTQPTMQDLTSKVQFYTELSGWVSIRQLSLGYKTMVAWMVDLAARLFVRYPDSDNPLAEPAIVLVDEIDLHMHPKWQRKIFDYLTERFPKTQFVVTAHSPLVVQAAPIDANIVLLRKEGDHVVIDNEIESVHNWRLDQILSSDLFGIDSARGPETEKWLEERKELLQKQVRTDEENSRLEILNKKADSLPTADNPNDIKAMEIIRKAAEYLQSQKA